MICIKISNDWIRTADLWYPSDRSANWATTSVTRLGDFIEFLGSKFCNKSSPNILHCFLSQTGKATFGPFSKKNLGYFLF